MAIVGGGPGGLGAAVGLAKRGIRPVLLLERADRLGGVPAKYVAKQGGMPTYISAARGRVVHGEAFADVLIEKLNRLPVESCVESTVVDLDWRRRRLTVVNPIDGMHVVAAKAIILATGAREQTGPERGWLSGSRYQASWQTMQLLELWRRNKRCPWDNAVVAGSDLIAYAVAAKLKEAGAGGVQMVDTTASPRTPLAARWYFRRWARPTWASEQWAHRQGSLAGDSRVVFSSGAAAPCDAFIISGQLVPNSELLVGSGIETSSSRHVPVASARGQLSAAGCFAVGNLLGGFHGGQWCYYNGRRVARAVASYLREQGAA